MRALPEVRSWDCVHTHLKHGERVSVQNMLKCTAEFLQLALEYTKKYPNYSEIHWHNQNWTVKVYTQVCTYSQIFVELLNQGSTYELEWYLWGQRARTWPEGGRLSP